jgi:hypothetical protein
MIPARDGWLPSGLLAVGAGAQIAAVQLIEAGAPDPQSKGRGFGLDLTGAKQGQEMTDEWRGTTMS